MLKIQITDNRKQFMPGEVVSGTVAWQLATAPKEVELQLLWTTQGKGDQDAGVVDTCRFERPAVTDQCSFEFRLPVGPYSFSGKLISLTWALELVVKPGEELARRIITVSPTFEEIDLYQPLS